MKKIRLIALLFAVLVLAAGCALFEEDKQEAVEITELEIDDHFNFETERWVYVELYALYTGTFQLLDMDDNLLFTGTIDSSDGFVQKIKLPSRITEVQILYKEVETIFKNYRISDDTISYSFVPQLR